MTGIGRSARAAAGLAGGVLIAAVACSSGPSRAGGEPSAGSLASSMRSAVRQASSVHAAGTLTNGSVPVGIDLDLHRNGDVAGTIRQNGAPFQLIGVRGTVYVKATRQFLQQIRAAPGACAIACGKWLRLRPSDARQVTSDLSMITLTAPLVAGRAAEVVKAGSTTIRGQRFWVLRGPGNSEVDVGETGRHFPVELRTARPMSGVTYTKWNSVPPPTAPPARQVIDAGQLP